MPQSEEELRKVPARTEVNAPTGPSEPKYLTKVAARVGKRIRFIRVADVHYFSGSGNYVEVHDSQGTVLIRESLSELEKKLSPKTFVRVSRTAIVNVDCVTEMHTKGKRDTKLCLQSGETIKLTRNLDQFRSVIQYS